MGRQLRDREETRIHRHRDRFVLVQDAQPVRTKQRELLQPRGPFVQPCRDGGVTGDLVDDHVGELMARDGERPGVVAARPIDGDLALVVDAGGLEAAFDRGRRDKDGRDPEDRRLRGAVAAIGRHDIHLRSGREAPCVVLLDARNVGGDLRADRRGVESRDRRFGVDIGRARRSHEKRETTDGHRRRRLDR